MAAFSVFAPGGAGEIGLFGVYRRDLEIGADDEEVELAARCFALPGFEDDSSFEHARGGYQAGSRSGDGSEEFLALRLAEKDGRESGRVDDHIRRSTGKPVLVVAQDFVCGARIENGQLVDAAKDFLQLVRKNLTSALVPKPRKTLFQGSLDSASQGFSSLGSDLPRQTFCFHTLDTKRHSNCIIP